MKRETFQLVTGAHAVEEALRSAPETVIELLVESPGTREARGIANLARTRGIEVRVLSAGAFRDLVRGRVFQGIAARVAHHRYADDDDIRRAVLADPPGLGVALDSVQDPQNLGSILRTSAFFGVRGVLIPRDRAVPVTPAVVRASAGAAVRVPVARVTNLARTLRAWREAGVRIVGSVAHGGDDVAALGPGGPMLLVLGSEHQGLRRLVRESCDALVTIPSRGGFESLNVGVAAGVLIHALTRLDGGDHAPSASERGASNNETL